ncbi:MAG: MarC family protein [Pseudomonadota bacterium]
MDFLIHIFITMFIVIDPIGVASIFIAMVRGSDPAFRRAMALRSTAIASIILLIFFFTGDSLLHMLGISLPAFRIAGGALLFLLAIDMVFARHSGLRSTTAGEQQEAVHKHDISVFPLAFPLIAGPGALTTVLLMSTTPSTTPIFIGMFLILLFVLGLTLVSLLYASKISDLLGETGVNVISRLFGLILAALAVQYVMDGLKAAFAP